MRDFIKTSLAFTLGLVIVLATTDRFLDWRTAHLHGKTTLSPEIYQAIEKANQPSDAVHFIYLGDSVAHQLFVPGSETRADELFLTSNQAGSLAAQYYILADAVRSFPNLRTAYLFYTPRSFENDLGPPFANDYFCGFFHSPAEMREVYGVKHDVHLLLVQVGRLLLPNILANNSLNRPMVWEGDPSNPTAAPKPTSSDPEPLVALLDRMSGRVVDDPPPPLSPRGQPVYLSRVSRHYLAAMHTLCQNHGIPLHVLPCPCSDRFPYEDPQHIYDGPILHRPAAQFGDGIHVREPFRDSARRELETAYNLPSH